MTILKDDTYLNMMHDLSGYHRCFCSGRINLLPEILIKQKKQESIGKAINRDHSWPDQIDHQKTQLDTCFSVLYVISNLTGQMWS